MIRFSLLIVGVLVLFSSCAGSPHARSEFRSEIAACAGSAEDTETVQKAGSPERIKRMKAEDARVLVANYNADIDEYLAAGDYAAVLDSFNRAADAMASLRKDSDVVVSIRDTMKRVIGSIQLTPVSVPGDTVSGRAFSRDFSVKVSISDEKGAVPLAGFPCRVSYPVYGEDGSISNETADIVTNSTGIAVFKAPVPQRTGKNTLSISLSIPLRDTVIAAYATDRIRDGVLSVSFVHGVETTRKNIPTTISFLDYDANGKPIISNNRTATSLLRPLIQKGFSRIGMADFPRQLAAGDEEKLIAAARAQFGGGVQRFIYGTNRIESLEKGSDGQWHCSMRAELSVWDFTRNEKVYSITITHGAAGATEAAAMDMARNELAGSLLVDALRYNL